MIESIAIKNIALIDELSIDLNGAFTVLSGETGAGKSILIGALNFLLGAKAQTDTIRTGTDEASVSASFYLTDKHPRALEWLNSRGIELDGGRIFLRRTLKGTGRSGAWIQNTPISRPELEEFTSYLVDIHGQHDHQSLFKTAEHRRFLDSYAGITAEVAQFTASYTRLAETRAKLDKLQLSEKERLERIDYLSFVIEEIEKAAVHPHEDEELEAEESKLCQYEKLYEYAEQFNDVCMGDSGIVPMLKKLRNLADTLTHIDSGLAEYTDRIENAYYEMEDIGTFFASYTENLVFDPQRLETVQDRLATLNKLKKKYGETIEAVLQYQEDAQKQLDSLTENEDNKDVLVRSIAVLEETLFKAGQILSEKRTAAARSLEAKTREILCRLGMPKVQFEVRVCGKGQEGNKQAADPYGFDTVEFLISANPGEPVKPLNKVASGGELSRIMLALKTVLASVDEADTLVFDEIDTGIGGEVARAVAEHLKHLAQEKQILCITHLAVIAACADTHIKIQKIQSGNVSRTAAETVTGDSRIDEIARMLAGDEVSAASRTHAQELLRQLPFH